MCGRDLNYEQLVHAWLIGRYNHETIMTYPVQCNEVVFLCQGVSIMVLNSHIGANSRPFMGPVANLSATYIPDSDLVLVTWENMDSMTITNVSYTYKVFYDITVAGIVLLSGRGAPDDGLAGNFIISGENSFFQAGVSVNVTVVATDMMDMSFNTSTTAEIDGGKEKQYTWQIQTYIH